MADRGRVALFVTCLVDVLRPRIAFAAARLISAAGYSVSVPSQGCCGQPNWNGGDRAGAAGAARALISAFEGFDHVVAPSGSCAAMVKVHMPSLFEVGTDDHRRAESLGARTHELSVFLAEIAGAASFPDAQALRATYHDACSGLRELGIKEGPRALLRRVPGLEINEMRDPESCCGFGGTFCVKYPEISGRIVEEKLAQARATGAEAIIAGDLGCLLNIEGKADRAGETIRVLHYAEVLAGLTGDEA